MRKIIESFLDRILGQALEKKIDEIQKDGIRLSAESARQLAKQMEKWDPLPEGPDALRLLAGILDKTASSKND